MPRGVVKSVRYRASGKSDEELAREVGFHLRTARRLVGFSQTKLAQLAGVSRSTVINAESGKHVMSIVALLRCYEAMGIGFKPYFLDEPEPDADASQTVNE